MSGTVWKVDIDAKTATPVARASVVRARSGALGWSPRGRRLRAPRRQYPRHRRRATSRRLAGQWDSRLRRRRWRGGAVLDAVCMRAAQRRQASSSPTTATIASASSASTAPCRPSPARHGGLRRRRDGRREVQPSARSLDRLSGDFYITDQDNYRVRKISSALDHHDGRRQRHAGSTDDDDPQRAVLRPRRPQREGRRLDDHRRRRHARRGGRHNSIRIIKSVNPVRPSETSHDDRTFNHRRRRGASAPEWRIAPRCDRRPRVRHGVSASRRSHAAHAVPVAHRCSEWRFPRRRHREQGVVQDAGWASRLLSRTTRSLPETADNDDVRSAFGLGCDGVVEVMLAQRGNTPGRIDPLAVADECLRTQKRGAVVTVIHSRVSGVKVGQRVSVIAGAHRSTTRSDELPCASP